MAEQRAHADADGGVGVGVGAAGALGGSATRVVMASLQVARERHSNSRCVARSMGLARALGRRTKVVGIASRAVWVDIARPAVWLPETVATTRWALE